VLPLPLKGKAGFAVEVDGANVTVDANGDGKPEQKIKGQGSIVQLTLVHGDDTKCPYAVKVSPARGAASSFERSCAMVGTVNGQKLTLLDENHNGIYNEIGRDACAVGNGEYSSPLGKLIDINGVLCEIQVDMYGRKVWTKPYEGSTGKLDMAGKFQPASLLAWAVVTDGKDMFFEVAGAKPRTLPVGEYKVLIGMLINGRETASFRQGQMEPIKIEKDGNTVPAMGAPFLLDFAYAVDKKTSKVTCKDLKVFGCGKEEYYEFQPGLAPEIVLYNTGDQKVGGGVWAMG
jgi:hypothetical protein